MNTTPEHEDQWHRQCQDFEHHQEQRQAETEEQAVDRAADRVVADGWFRSSERRRHRAYAFHVMAGRELNSKPISPPSQEYAADDAGNCRKRESTVELDPTVADARREILARVNSPLTFVLKLKREWEFLAEIDEAGIAILCVAVGVAARVEADTGCLDGPVVVARSVTGLRREAEVRDDAPGIDLERVATRERLLLVEQIDRRRVVAQIGRGVDELAVAVVGPRETTTRPAEFGPVTEVGNGGRLADFCRNLFVDRVTLRDVEIAGFAFGHERAQRIVGIGRALRERRTTQRKRTKCRAGRRVPLATRSLVS